MKRIRVHHLTAARAEAFVSRVIADLGATLGTLLVCTGDVLGLYRTLGERGAMTATELAQSTGIAETYLRGWLLNQAASGYLDYDPDSERYHLPPEHAAVLADERSAHYLGQAFHAVRVLVRDHPELFDARFDPPASHLSNRRGGEPFLFPGIVARLVRDWIPALTGVHEQLVAGGRAGEIGCGVGAATIAMAKAYPAAHIWGFDAQLPNIRFAQRRAVEEAVAGQTTFEARPADLIANHRYALLAVLSSLSQFDDPPGVLRRARATLHPTGCVLLVEPVLEPVVQANFTPAGRLYSALSALRQRPEATATDSASGPARIEALLMQAGFTRARLVDTTPFLRAIEARL